MRATLSPAHFEPITTEGSIMSFHVICPSLRCRKILTLADEARGSLVSCRYCSMQFRVPQYRAARQPQRAVPPSHVRQQKTAKVR